MDMIKKREAYSRCIAIDYANGNKHYVSVTECPNFTWKIAICKNDPDDESGRSVTTSEAFVGREVLDAMSEMLLEAQTAGDNLALASLPEKEKP